MRKWKVAYDSNRKYNSEWEKRFVWLKRRDASGPEGLCKLCHCTVACKLDSLTKHEKTLKHRQNQPSRGQRQFATGTSSLTGKAQPGEPCRDVKTVELQLAVSVACHCSITAVDHLG